MSKTIKYSDVQYQISKLKSQKLIISDEKEAAEKLQCFGYSNLIKSYREPYFVKNTEQDAVYKNGVKFEQIESLYILDKNLRNSVMAAMLDLEEHIKEAAANSVAEAFGVDQSQYLEFRN